MRIITDPGIKLRIEFSIESRDFIYRPSFYSTTEGFTFTHPKHPSTDAYVLVESKCLGPSFLFSNYYHTLKLLKLKSFIRLQSKKLTIYTAEYKRFLSQSEAKTVLRNVFLLHIPLLTGHVLF